MNEMSHPAPTERSPRIENMYHLSLFVFFGTALIHRQILGMSPERAIAANPGLAVVDGVFVAVGTVLAIGLLAGWPSILARGAADPHRFPRGTVAACIPMCLIGAVQWLPIFERYPHLAAILGTAAVSRAFATLALAIRAIAARNRREVEDFRARRAAAARIAEATRAVDPTPARV